MSLTPVKKFKVSNLFMYVRTFPLRFLQSTHNVFSFKKPLLIVVSSPPSCRPTEAMADEKKMRKEDAFSFHLKTSTMHICPHRDEEFAKVGILCHHVSKVHKNNATYYDRECPFCSKRLATASSLSWHVGGVHKSSSSHPHKCKECLKVFTRREHVKSTFSEYSWQLPKDFHV